MRRRIILAPEATADRERLAAFLVDVNPRAALDVADTIIEALATLAQFPERGALLDNGLRQLIIPFGMSGYVAQYRVDPDVVIIACIFHMRETR